MVGDEVGESPTGAGLCRTLYAMPGSLDSHTLSRKYSCWYEGSILSMNFHSLSPPDLLMYSTEHTQAGHHA